MTGSLSFPTGPAPASEPRITRGDPDCSRSVELLRERLAETVSWCTRRSGLGMPGGALRSVQLAPPPALPWIDTVRAVGEQRQAWLGRSWRRTLEPLAGGRLVVYFPDRPHSHGAAREISEGYFDARDVPPWDTWVGFFEEPGLAYLVAWVPPGSLGPASQAITRRPNALDWLDQSDVGIGPLILR